jgi:hypothetical protein
MAITGKNITYKELAPLLKTGDIVLFHGDSNFQEVIDVLTGSPYNHMAMVVLAKDIGANEPMAPIMLWESTPYTITEDQKIHKPKAGPTLVDLEIRINDEIERGMFSRFVFRRLSKELAEPNFKALNEVFKKTYPDKFPTDFWFFVKGIIGRLFGREVKKNTYFCSELIAYTYQKMGLLTTEHPPDFYWPKDFSEKGHLPLEHNLSLGENLLLELAIRQ